MRCGKGAIDQSSRGVAARLVLLVVVIATGAFNSATCGDVVEAAVGDRDRQLEFEDASAIIGGEEYAPRLSIGMPRERGAVSTIDQFVLIIVKVGAVHVGRWYLDDGIFGDSHLGRRIVNYATC